MAPNAKGLPWLGRRTGRNFWLGWRKTHKTVAADGFTMNPARGVRGGMLGSNRVDRADARDRWNVERLVGSQMTTYAGWLWESIAARAS